MRVQDSESRLGAGRQAGGWASRRGNSPAWGMHVMRARQKKKKKKKSLRKAPPGVLARNPASKPKQV